jgi:hypothetical protein
MFSSVTKKDPLHVKDLKGRGATGRHEHHHVQVYREEGGAKKKEHKDGRGEGEKVMAECRI